jgi:hypothetical protein
VITSEQESNSWQGFTISETDFVSLDTALAKTPRNADSSLPFIDFLRLKTGSSLVDAGVDVGLPFLGSAPDLGAFEYGAIPVEFTSFAGRVSGNKILLNWSTASESNNYGFEIQKKYDSDFKTIGFVLGRGTTVETNHYSFSYETVFAGINIFRLKQVDYSGTFSYSDEVQLVYNIPERFGLSQNFPNPFNPYTKFIYNIKEPGNVELKIYNALGKEVAIIQNDFQNPGRYEKVWEARDSRGISLPSGIYIAKLKSGNQVQTIKLSLIK